MYIIQLLWEEGLSIDDQGQLADYVHVKIKKKKLSDESYILS